MSENTDTDHSQYDALPTDEKEATIAILRRMLTKRAGPKNQLRSEELSQVVPSDKRDKTKQILDAHVRDPDSPIQTYADRDTYTLTSLEKAADLYETLTGESFDYRANEHTIDFDDTEPVTARMTLEWEYVEAVKQVMDDRDEVRSFTVEYDDHPPAVRFTAHPDDYQAICDALWKATGGEIP